MSAWIEIGKEDKYYYILLARISLLQTLDIHIQDLIELLVGLWSLMKSRYF